MDYTPRAIAAWTEVMSRLEAEQKADDMEVVRATNANAKDMRRVLKQLREQV